MARGNGGAGIVLTLVLAGGVGFFLWTQGGALGGNQVQGHGTPDLKQLPNNAVDTGGKAVSNGADAASGVVEHASQIPGFGTFLAVCLIGVVGVLIWRSMSKGLAVTITIIAALILAGMTGGHL